MPLFLYTARDLEGKTLQGQQEAASEGAAISILQGNGLFITQIVNTATQIKSKAQSRRRLHRKISSQDLIFFISQTANLLLVGIPFVRSLEVIADQTESAGLLKIIQEMIANVKAGSTFKDAMARHPKVFPFFWSYLVEAGELSGTLPQVMAQLAKNLEATENLKKKITSALVYPSVIITAAVAAIIFFMLFIVPIFTNLFKAFNAQLPPLTQFIVNLSNFLKHYFIFIAAGAVGANHFLQRYFRTSNGRRTLHAFFLKAPIIGGATSDIIHARVCIILSMLIRSGLSFLKSLEVTANVSGNCIFETALSNTRLDVQQGRPLSSSLADNALFSPMFVNLVKIGEESGKLPEMIEKASEYFTSRVDVFAGRVGILIEPFIMVFVGGIIGVIAVSLFLPIIKLSSAVS